MSRTLAELLPLVAEVSDTYASRNDIRRDDDWYLLKLQEELGAQSEWLAMLNQQDGEADALQGSIDNMLNAKLASVKDSAKDRLKDSLRDRLGGDKTKEE